MRRALSRWTASALFVAAFATVIVVQAQAPAGRYTISGGTVYDTKTKLTWQQTPSETTLSQSGASSYCAGLSLGAPPLQWRVPTFRELVTIVDLTSTPPVIDSTSFPNTPSALFWTASAFPGGTYLIDFGLSDGLNTGSDSSAMNYVRCVH